ncbi:DUF6318 family protein [Arthrobacter sp. QXT-31]|uniref:DUF6318 family protein n=1 Tax=Arthrobacter sp. QXT-31 TaxID=1357915 RepID=UPI000971ABD2|nr:DUF6318 family protein [Arthrobacter sp. QXT-31]APX01287.1 hypothetical protein BWQ92_05705 [Arthrobacter sp. QXT-31]
MTSRTCSSERLRLPLISAVAVSVLVLTSCSGGGEPQAGPTASAVASPALSTSGSASATPSATPTPKPTPVYKPADAKGRAQNVPVPVKPPLADKNTKEGLEAFTKYWYALLNYGFETGDLSSWAELTSGSCEFCNLLKKSIAIGYKEGRWQVGGRLSAPSIEANFKTGAGSQQVLVQVIQEETQFYKADKSVGRSPAAGSNTASVVIATYSGNRWTVADLHPVR